MLQNVARECGQNVAFKIFPFKNKGKEIFEFWYCNMQHFGVLTATFSMSPYVTAYE